MSTKTIIKGIIVVFTVVAALVILVDFGGESRSFRRDDAVADGRCRVLAHRGSSEDRPENTLAAIRRAIEVAADGVEIDVRTTRDGHLVLMHDASVDRTTDGAGRVNELTLGEIKELDAGSWFAPAYSDQRVPTLAEALDLCREHDRFVLLDLKEQGREYAEAVAAAVLDFGDPTLTIVGVRSVEQAMLFRELLPESRQLGFIRRLNDIEAYVEAGVDIIRLWPRWLENDDSAVDRVRQAGAALHLNAVVGDVDEVRGLMHYEPDWILCDDPAEVMEIMAILRQETDGLETD